MSRTLFLALDRRDRAIEDVHHARAPGAAGGRGGATPSTAQDEEAADVRPHDADAARCGSTTSSSTSTASSPTRRTCGPAAARILTKARAQIAATEAKINRLWPPKSRTRSPRGDPLPPPSSGWPSGRPDAGRASPSALALLAGCGGDRAEPTAAAAPATPTPSPSGRGAARARAAGAGRTPAPTPAAVPPRRPPRRAGVLAARGGRAPRRRRRHRAPVGAARRAPRAASARRQIADFAAIRRQLDERAYTWDLWGAAYVIEDGCSDDCFRDFRAYLISLGPHALRGRAARPRRARARGRGRGDGRLGERRRPRARKPTRTRAGEELPAGDGDLSGRPAASPGTTSSRSS